MQVSDMGSLQSKEHQRAAGRGKRRTAPLGRLMDAPSVVSAITSRALPLPLPTTSVSAVKGRTPEPHEFSARAAANQMSFGSS